MKIYAVGGWVRDKILGIPANDKDYVVVGSTIEEMLSLGYEQVGKAFPVFLHPETKEEYALARKDKKVGNGYTGFDFDFNPNITLEEDLQRRDFTINSIAYNESTNTYIDPYNGIEDLHNKVLRHTSSAFSDDPLRVLRALRLASKYNLNIHTDTQTLLKQVIKSNDFKYLSEERFIVELEKVLKSKSFDYFELAHEYGVYTYYYNTNFDTIFYQNSIKLKTFDSTVFLELNKKFDYTKLCMSILYNGIDDKYLNKIDADIKQVIVSYKKCIPLLAQVNEENLINLFFMADYSRRPWILEYILMYSNNKDYEYILFLFNTLLTEIKSIDYTTINIKDIKQTKINIWKKIYTDNKGLYETIPKIVCT